MAVRTPTTNEDDWAAPTAWWSKSDPFRGLGPARRTTVNAAAAAAVADTLARSADKIRTALQHPRSHNVFRQRGLAYLSAPDADPIGAAVCAAVGIDAYILNPDGLGRYYDDNTDLADYLVHTHGFELATSMTAAVAGIHCEFDSLIPNEWYRNSDPANYRVATGVTDPPVTVIRRLRALLAAANDAEYAGALTVAARLRRGGSLPIRLLTSYLFPTEQHWVADDLADPSLSAPNSDAILLLASVTDPSHAHRIVDLLGQRWSGLHHNPSLLFNVATQLGPSAADVIIRIWKEGWGNAYAPKADKLGRILAHLPDDAAMHFLADESWRGSTTAALQASTERFPARALRVLAERAGRLGTEDAFLEHAQRHLELAAAVRHQLPILAQQLLTEILPDPIVSPASDTALM
ncbi:hypothetical protein [Nocardia sp. NPDC057440]|uniref:hypothetical protein n=1 Tax=Nocardia sp. NPDC057440 TaxID=3346134 RepID=UPI0036702855